MLPIPKHLMTDADLTLAPDVPVQYFQSIIAVLLAIAGALLFQVRFLDTTSQQRCGTKVLRARGLHDHIRPDAPAALTATSDSCQ
jgi:hypothetical protein